MKTSLNIWQCGIFCCGILLISNIFAEQQVITVGPVVKTQAQEATVVANQTAKPGLIVLQPTLAKYAVEVPVTGYGDSERKMVLVKALQQALTAAAATPTTLKSSPVRVALLDPSTLVQSYSYVNRAMPQMPQALYLHVQFEPRSMEKLLQPPAQITSGNESSKPQVLLWLVKNTGANKIFEDETSNDMLIPIVRKNAADLGVAITFPTMDLQDLAKLSANDICNFNLEAIKAASQRYGTANILIGCIHEPVAALNFTSEWVYLRGLESNRYAFSGNDINSMVVKPLQIVAGTGQKSVVVNNRAEKLILHISNVSGLDQYNQVLQYLHSFSPISQIELLDVGANEIQISLSCAGGRESLVALLQAQQKLVALNNSVTADLSYKWNSVAE